MQGIKRYLLCVVILKLIFSSVLWADTKGIGVQQAVEMLSADMKTPQRYALIIGVSNYKDDRIPSLPTCVNDAKTLQSVLLDPMHGMFTVDNTRLLINEEANRANIVDALDKISRRAGKDDLVIIYFSGNGAVDEQGRSYWVAYDTDITRLRATAISESDITELTKSIVSQRLVMLIDSCYSVATAQVSGPKALVDLEQIYPKFTGQGRVAITSGKGDQLSVVIKDKDSPGYGFSVFSWNIVSGLKGAGDVDNDGIVTVSELWDYVKYRTESIAILQGGNQQPQLKGQIGGKFLLTVDGQRLIENTQLIKESLDNLRLQCIDKKITLEQYNQAEELIKKDTSKLMDADRQRRQVYLDLAKGSLNYKYLQAALDAIETPAQRAERLSREMTELADQQRLYKIASLLQTAKSKDNKEHSNEALAALSELLKLDPDNTEALYLKKKITGYQMSSTDTVRLMDDFSDGDYTNGLRWFVRNGCFKVDSGALTESAKGKNYSASIYTVVDGNIVSVQIDFVNPPQGLRGEHSMAFCVSDGMSSDTINFLDGISGNYDLVNGYIVMLYWDSVSWGSPMEYMRLYMIDKGILSKALDFGAISPIIRNSSKHTLKLTVDGGVVRAELDGVIKNSVKDSTYSDFKVFTINSYMKYYDIDAKFDNIIITYQGSNLSF
jgi:hypothetical protein